MNRIEIMAAIRAEIEANSLTEYQVAKRADLRRSTVNFALKPDWGQQLETLCKIAAAVGLEITVRKKDAEE